jgi:hypothetical protein
LSLNATVPLLAPDPIIFVGVLRADTVVVLGPVKIPVEEPEAAAVTGESNINPSIFRLAVPVRFMNDPRETPEYICPPSTLTKPKLAEPKRPFGKLEPLSCWNRQLLKSKDNPDITKKS